MDDERLCEDCSAPMNYYKSVGHYDLYQCLSCKHIEKEPRQKCKPLPPLILPVPRERRRD